MEIKDWKSCLTQSKLYRELASIELIENIAELDVFGFTVVPPEKVASPEFHARVKQALVGVVERRFGPFGDDGMTWKDQNQTIRMILWEDPIFEELLLNPAALGLAQYLVGTNCILTLFDGWVKGPGKGRTPIHRDNYSLFDREPAGDEVSVRPDYDYLKFDADARREMWATMRKEADADARGPSPQPVRK